MKVHKTEVRVYFADTDAGGVVYHSKYLDFAERARAEYFRDINYESSKIFRETRCGFVVSSCNIKFISPAKLDDLLEIETKIKEIRKASIIINHRIMHGGNLMVEIDMVLPFINEQFKPRKLPPELLKAIEEK